MQETTHTPKRFQKAIILMAVVLSFFAADPMEATSMTHSDELQQELQAVLKAKGPDYKPRTRHLLPDGSPKYTNRLIQEGSPYLLQHAHNPVDWHSWGDEAFTEAKRLGRPVFLSVGYSTCHWCHVMEEESFEDEEVARYLNEHFVAIKVDREERPDIDSIYMTAVQALTGRGGWPMSVFLTPDRKPFYGGTYFPARDGDRGVSMGFLTLLAKVDQVYQLQPDKILETSKQLTRAIEQQLTPVTGKGMPSANLLHRIIGHYQKNSDPVYGGMAGQPKFPSSLPVRLLLRYYRRTNDNNALKIADLALKQMANGGMYDHVGGGFHRYSVDSKWLVPHFEKMLYDNALLAMDFLDGYQITGNNDFKRVVTEILDYIQRDMTTPGGAFYSATDADSLTPTGNREEGYYFTWIPTELNKVLDPETARIVKAYYAVGDIPNFEGRNILHTPKAPTKVAQTLDISQDQLMKAIAKAKKILYQARNNRPLPLRDEKVLAAWNGLMISAFARAGLILNEDRYVEQGVKAAQFILDNLFIDHTLFRSFKDGKARHTGYIDDYAFITAALIDLYEATHHIKWLEQAIEMDTIIRAKYEDPKNGGFFMTAKDSQGLIAREKPNHDGAEPSGNSVALMNLLRLGEYTTQDSYRQRAEKILASFLGENPARAAALSEMLLALDFHLDQPKGIVIVTPSNQPDAAEPFLTVFREQYLPNRILTVVGEGGAFEAHACLVPLVGEKIAINGQTTAYVCQKGVCELPATNPKAFAKQLRTVFPLADAID